MPLAADKLEGINLQNKIFDGSIWNKLVGSKLGYDHQSC